MPVHHLPAHAEIAITAGSRGITNIVEILRSAVETLKQMGFKPFLVPAMGSHGGATDRGQLNVLKHLGITETSVGAPIRSSMETELLGHTSNGKPVYMDKIAFSANGIIVINRVKAHTAFRGKIESGLSKMITIGLGKRKGASFVHSDGALKMAENIESVSKFALENSNIQMGLAVVENGYEATAEVVGINKRDWHKQEAELLQQSKAMMPGLPVDNIHLLIVEEMGKTFSGTGMDPNIIGRWRINGVPEPESPEIKKIAVLDLSASSFGNAQGIGLADFTTMRLFNKIDRKSTYTNALTSTYLQRAMIPLIYETEQETIETALQSLGPDTDIESLKIVQIPNTLHLESVFVSRAVLKELEQSNKEFEVVGRHLLSFDKNHDLENKLTVTSR
ncbi:lactate racemase domain-containing protein [Halobacillus naozhouensis]|uniref:Lactate racemase domain-containing protein n=1 Tax=Halobacillus naozhouensis TaxID=554880 RepID=A0ABY8IZK2_9BACI|nr:lactate racemase domain-containing protein [Halobacillus naozhouensis]WFT75648.1 lactate racemase domain-containing protein [Halobacillus naozhouensis]